jgi:hypothetical protein
MEMDTYTCRLKQFAKTLLAGAKSAKISSQANVILH